MSKRHMDPRASSPARLGDRVRSVVVDGLLPGVVGSAGMYLAVRGFGDQNRNAIAFVMLLGVVWACALCIGVLRTVSGACLGAVAVAVAVVVPASRVGHTPVILAILGVGVAQAALVEWRPLRSWPQRRHRVVLLAVPLVVGAEILWAVRQQPAGTIVLLVAAMLPVEVAGRFPEAYARWERAPRRLVDRAGAWVRSMELISRLARTLISLAHRASVFRHSPANRRRSLVAAAVVGFGLRLAWAMAQTRGISQWYSIWNLRIARSFAHWETPKFGGIDTAYWPPGHGAMLAPLAWISEHTGWFSLSFASSVANVVFGTLTIFLVAALAKEWISADSANPAAWLMAIAPGHIYTTSVAVAEPLAVMLWAALALAFTLVIKRRVGRDRDRMLFATGVVLGYACLTKDVSITLLALPALVIRVSAGSWRGAGRAVVATGVGAAVLLVPWAARNAVQVGHVSPFATISSEGLCVAKYEPDVNKYNAAGGGPNALSRELLVDCYTGSIWDTTSSEQRVDMPSWWRFGTSDEGAWARRNNLGFLRWALDHPLHFLEVAPMRLYTVAGNDSHGGWEIASQYGPPLASETVSEFFRDAANGWYFLTLGLFVIGMASNRRLRRLAPLWFPVLVLWTYTIAGPYGQSRHAYFAHPFLVVIASATLLAARQWSGPHVEPAVGAAAGDAPSDASAERLPT